MRFWCICIFPVSHSPTALSRRLRPARYFAVLDCLFKRSGFHRKPPSGFGAPACCHISGQSGGRSESRQVSQGTCRLMVPLTRLELVQHCCRGILSPLCLPIPPQRQETVCLYHRLFPPPCQDDKRVIFKKMKKAPHCGGKPQPGRINRRRRRTLRVKVRGGCRILRRLQDLLKKRIAFLHAVWYHRVHVFYDKKEE